MCRARGDGVTYAASRINQPVQRALSVGWRGNGGRASPELLAGQSWRQFLRIEVGRDNDERVVMRRARQRAGPENSLLLYYRPPYLSDGFDLAFGEAGH